MNVTKSGNCGFAHIFSAVRIDQVQPEVYANIWITAVQCIEECQISGLLSNIFKRCVKNKHHLHVNT